MPDAAKTEKKQEAAEAAPPAKEGKGSGGGGKLVPALLGLNSLLIAGVLAVVLLRPAGLAHPPAPKAGEKGEEAAAAAGHEQEGHEPAKEPAKEGGAKGKEGKGHPGPMLRLPDFVVHLRDEGADRYARISFEVEVADEKAKELVTARLPVIRDSFLAYLSDRTSADLRGGEAIAQVKQALAQRLADVAAGAPVKALYVTELVVQ